jgi:hypothetical protein
MAFSIILCVIGVFGEFVKRNNEEKDTNIEKSHKASIQLLEARPGNTTIGTSETSIKEIKDILNNEVLPKLEESCFSDPPDIALYGKIDFLIYQGSKGYANNWSISETNIDQSCIRDIFRGTRFPEPTDPVDTLKDAKTGTPIYYPPEYWVSITFKMKK